VFDVIVVETDSMHRPPGYADEVVKYLAARGYRKVAVKGRNTCKKI
jgi:hypothetical protein